MPDEKRREPRAPAKLLIRLGYGSIDELVERHALNISRGGIFVRTVDVRPPGTPVTLAIDLASGENVIRGRGIVAWTAPAARAGEPPRPAGMGIRFIELDPESRALVDLVVATRGPDAATDEPPRPGAGATSPAGEAVRWAGEPAGAPPAVPADAAPPTSAPGPASAPTANAPKPPSPRRPPPKIIGIDLGTTNSCVAFASGGKASVIASREGYRTIPSVVAYDGQGRLLVGRAAKAQMLVNPKNTVYGSKRLVGRPFASPTVQACRDRFHYDIVEGPSGAAAVRFAGREFSLQQISALVLREMKDVATQSLGEEVSRAVVTVPAYYNDHQRQAVREAGALAGLHVARIVNEPTAAALAFGYGRGLDKRVLVYDLGGGTFDVSVLEVQGDVYEVVSTGGDTFLGGVDFDNQVVDHLIYAFAEKNGFAPPEDPAVWQRIRDAAEETKIALSERESAVAKVPFLCKDPRGRDLVLEETVTRAQLEALTARLVDRTIEVCREVLAARSLGKGDIDEVLLVGGQSRMPLVWRKIHEEFGREPNKSVHPDEAVALGAALLADSESRIDAVVLIDVLTMGIGVGLPGGRLAPILPRNTRLPAKKGYELATTKDGQTELELAVFQGDSPRISECEYLGTVRVTKLPPKPRGAVKVAVEFALGAEGILAVTARNLATGDVTELQFATVDTPASLREKLGLPEPQVPPKGARPIEAVPGERAGPGRRGLLGKLFGKR